MAAEAQKLKLKAKYAPGSEKAKASNHVYVAFKGIL